METLGEQVKNVVRIFPEKIAVKYENNSITFFELYERAMAMASYLQHIGMKKGDRFGVLMSNRLEQIELDLVAAFGGFIKVPLNYRLHPKEHAYMIEDADVSIIIGEASLITPIGLQTKTLFVDDAYEIVLEDYRGKEIKTIVEEEDVFAIMYTSGTTGNPKGVMLTHRNILAGASSLNEACEVNEEDIIGHVAPLTHGSNFLSHVSWLHGNTQVIYNKFEPEQFLNHIQEDKVSVIFLVPTMVNLMFQHPSFRPEKLQHIKSINMAGSPIAAAKLEEALQLVGTKFVQTFGQVEAPMCITIMPREEQKDRLSSCGREGPFVQMKIVDELFQEVPTGEVGEIVCKGPLVMKGYWNNEKATKETLVDGWLRTGDLGWVDSSGYLHIVDRQKEVIISGGVNIYPREIEEVISIHKGVKEVAVIGVPDEKWGEAVIAYVVPNGTIEINEETCVTLCTEHLASFKKPKKIYIVNSLPKSSYGKILKRALLEQYEKAVN